MRKNLEKQEISNGTCDISASENVPVLLLFHHGKRFVRQLRKSRPTKISLFSVLIVIVHVCLFTDGDLLCCGYEIKK